MGEKLSVTPISPKLPAPKLQFLYKLMVEIIKEKLFNFQQLNNKVFFSGLTLLSNSIISLSLE